MGITRGAVAATVLASETVVAVLVVGAHYAFTAEYGDVTDSTLEAMASGLATGVGGVGLVVVATAGLVALSVSVRRWMRLVAVLVPVLMVLGMAAATPAALQRKLEVQYDAIPQCVSGEDMGPGPGTTAEQESQQAFDSIEHVGDFGGGGSSGVGGCARSFVLTEDVDVLGHYRAALPRAGWRVVEDDDRHLRAEREGMAFEVVTCDRGGVVWAGRVGDERLERAAVICATP
jgi:hypothetical protein